MKKTITDISRPPLKTLISTFTENTWWVNQQKEIEITLKILELIIWESSTQPTILETTWLLLVLVTLITKSSLLKSTNTLLLYLSKPHPRLRTRKSQSSIPLFFSSETMRWSTPTLPSSMMLHQSRIQIITLSFSYKTCSVISESTRMLNILMMLRNNTTQCTLFSVIFQMLPDKSLSITLIQTVECGVIISMVMKSSPDKWTIVESVCQPSMLIIWMTLKFSEEETLFITSLSRKTHQLRSSVRLDLKFFTLTEELLEVKLLRE